MPWIPVLPVLVLRPGGSLPSGPEFPRHLLARVCSRHARVRAQAPGHRRPEAVTLGASAFANTWLSESSPNNRLSRKKRETRDGSFFNPVKDQRQGCGGDRRRLRIGLAAAKFLCRAPHVASCWSMSTRDGLAGTPKNRLVRWWQNPATRRGGRSRPMIGDRNGASRGTGNAPFGKRYARGPPAE